MAEISFYHLSSTTLEKALPKLMEKVISSNKKSVILAENDEQMENLNNLLWTYSTKTFIPHGSSKDPFPEDQNVYLTTAMENPNNSTILVVTNGQIVNDFSNFEKCLDIFDGNNPDKINSARIRWNNYKKLGHNITYWKQQDNGTWEQG
ncbi:MAG: DNA polymerase III subunit chi [Alphaproteobacteria bacterium]